MMAAIVLPTSKPKPVMAVITIPAQRSGTGAEGCQQRKTMERVRGGTLAVGGCAALRCAALRCVPVKRRAVPLMGLRVASSTTALVM